MPTTRVSVTLKRHSFPLERVVFDQAFLAALQQCGQFLPEIVATIVAIRNCRDGCFGLPLCSRCPRGSPGPPLGLLARLAALRIAHAMELKHGVDRVACRRRDMEFAAEGANLAG